MKWLFDKIFYEGMEKGDFKDKVTGEVRPWVKLGFQDRSSEKKIVLTVTPATNFNFSSLPAVMEPLSGTMDITMTGGGKFPVKFYLNELILKPIKSA